VRPIADKKSPLAADSLLLQMEDFLLEGAQIHNDTIADHTGIPRMEYASRNQMQNMLVAINDYGVAGIMTAGVTGDDVKVRREQVYDLSLAFITPLGSNNY